MNHRSDAGATAEPADPPRPREGAAAEARDEDAGLRFRDPYWDDAFCAWWDPTLRTCC